MPYLGYGTPTTPVDATVMPFPFNAPRSSITSTSESGTALALPVVEPDGRWRRRHSISADENGGTNGGTNCGGGNGTARQSLTGRRGSAQSVVPDASGACVNALLSPGTAAARRNSQLRMSMTMPLSPVGAEDDVAAAKAAAVGVVSVMQLRVQRARDQMLMLVTSQAFSTFIVFVIVCNTVALAMVHHGASQEFNDVLGYCNYGFTAIFTVEMVLKLVALGPR